MPDDGIVQVPLPSPNEENEMPAADLPAAVAGQLLAETVGNIQQTNAAGRAIAVTAHGVLQGAMSRNFDELGVAESRSVSGVMATPVAAPAEGSR